MNTVATDILAVLVTLVVFATAALLAVTILGNWLR